MIRTSFSKEEVNKIGLRIKSCRTLTGLNQEEFSLKYGIPTASIKSWESGYVVPRLDSLNNFINYLRNECIFVDIDWIIYGQKTGPSYFLDEQNLTDLNNKSSFNIWFENFCKKNKTNPIVFSINDNDMNPIFYEKDLIAGVFINIKSDKINFSKPLIVKLDTGEYVVRYVHLYDEHIFARSINKPDLIKLSNNFVGVICWHNYF